MPNLNINRKIVIPSKISSSTVLATIYSQSFNDGIASDFTTNVASDWVLNDDGGIIPLSNGYTGASGGFHYAMANQQTSIQTLTFIGGVSTIGYVNIGVQWGGYIEPGFPAGSIAFEWSSNGTVWNNVAFTNVSSNSTWALVPLVSLPAGAAGLAILRLRWSYIGTNALIYGAIDDVKIVGYH